MAEPFATQTDLESRWRPLTTDELPRALTLLGDASRRVRRDYPTVDARIASGELDVADVAEVVSNAVRRAMLVEQDGIDQESETAGPFSVSRRFRNPMGALYFTADETQILGGVVSRRRRAFVVDLGLA